MYLGIDLGTSGVKALLIDEAQRVVASRSAPLTVQRPAPQWSEQDPAAWIAACEAAVDALAAAVPGGLAGLRGIGLSGQMHGAVLLDAGDRVLRPCILWNDTRAERQAATLDGDPRFRAITGNIVFPGFTAPKLVWTAEAEPRVFDRVARVLLPKDYLRLWLTGEHVSEMSDASGTSWLDVGARDWSDDLLAATGMRRAQMPSLVEGSDVSGGLRADLAARWGVRAGLPVAGGAGDNAAAGIGAGCVAAGTGFVSLGTSGVLFAATEGYRPAPESAVHTFAHALPGAWHQMGVILSATAALEWFAGIAGESAAALTGRLGPGLEPPGEAVFLPYLSGERTPWNDAGLRGGFHGLTHGSDRAALTRAVLEGVAFALKDNAEALRAAGTEIGALIAVGGGTASDYWLRVIATVLGVPVLRPEGGDFGAAFGAARLGLMAAEGAGMGICTPPAIAEEIAPDAALSDAFEDGWRRFGGFRALQGGGLRGVPG